MSCWQRKHSSHHNNIYYIVYIVLYSLCIIFLCISSSVLLSSALARVMDLFSRLGRGPGFGGFGDFDDFFSRPPHFPDWFDDHLRPPLGVRRGEPDEGAQEFSPGDEGLLRYLKSQPEMNGKMALVQRATWSFREWNGEGIRYTNN